MQIALFCSEQTTRGLKGVSLVETDIGKVEFLHLTRDKDTKIPKLLPTMKSKEIVSFA